MTEAPGVHQWELTLEYFAERVLREEAIAFPAENGLANMRVMDAIYRSGRERSAVGLR